MADKKMRHKLTASVKAALIALLFLILGFQSGKLFNVVLRGEDASEDPAPVGDASATRDTVSTVPGKGEAKAAAIQRHNARERGGKTVEDRRNVPDRKQIESFVFNPNTISREDLQRLGFSAKQAQAILNYREKGGRFHRKEDFAKSFVVSDSVFRRLEPFIDIPLLDINTADSAAFDALPGIGPYFAARMVSYRKSLGGYSYTEQLMDIRNFDREKYEGLRDLIFAGPSEPYRLWSLPEDSLKAHPYIGSYAAHGIIVYKENTPPEEWSVLNLGKAGILRPDTADKLAACRLESALE